MNFDDDFSEGDNSFILCFSNSKEEMDEISDLFMSDVEDDSLVPRSNHSDVRTPSFDASVAGLENHYSGATMKTNAVEVNKDYEILGMAQIRVEMNHTIKDTAEFLNVPNDLTEILLRMYKWQADYLAEEWADNPAKVLHKVNINIDEYPESATHEADATTDDSKEFFCPVIADVVPYSDTSSLICGHRFSNACWEGYINASMDESSQHTLSMRCPEIKCGIPVSIEFWMRFLPTNLFERFCAYRANAYVTDSPCLTFCPGADCESVIKIHSINTFDVECSCGQKFCFACAEEQHQPVPCEIIARWTQKNCNEADNVKWILVHTKNCPSCKHPIEKNQGCMHMRCRCNHEFCWLCLTPWSKHDSSAVWQCNVYDRDKSKFDGQESEKQKAKEYLERFAHYFERFSAHSGAQKQASKELLSTINSHMVTLHNMLGQVVEIEFLQDAVKQIIECRRILKWSYAFGYFAKWNNTNSRYLFEYHQGQLEKTLDLLHELTEKFDADKFLSDYNNNTNSLNFKTELINLTRVVKDFFCKMSEAFKTDFIEYALPDDKM